MAFSLPPLPYSTTALAANGKSTIHNIEQIDRGYQNIEQRLRALGADIKRID